jgi:hypothetical protein
MNRRGWVGAKELKTTYPVVVVIDVLGLASGCEPGQARPKSWLGMAFGLV